MLELRLRESGARPSTEDETPLVTDAPIDEVHDWANSSIDLQRGLDVVELGATSLPIDPADLQAP